MLVVFLRVLIIYILIVASLRLMGKRQLGQLQPSELVITILISNIATMAIEDSNLPLMQGIIPILALASFDIIVSYLSLKFKKVRQLASGTPKIIIRDGKLDQKQLFELRYAIDDVMEQLRTKNIFDVRDIAFAVVETTGSISIYPNFQNQPVTAGMLKLQGTPADSAPPAVLISDGFISKGGLDYCNLTRKWLDKTLASNGYTVKDVFLMVCNRQADYQIVPIDKPKKKEAAGE
jgi:uncharacterized membrane protein YcaP (DUF421 family)